MDAALPIGSAEGRRSHGKIYGLFALRARDLGFAPKTRRGFIARETDRQGHRGKIDGDKAMLR
jgi:hypothetical protein